MKRTVFLPIICLMLAAFPLGCSDEDGEPTVVGYWKLEGEEIYFAFLPDGTLCQGFTLAGPLPECYTGTYSCSGGQCVLKREDSEGVTVNIVAIEENRLCLASGVEAPEFCFKRISSRQLPCDRPPPIDLRRFFPGAVG